MLIHQLAEAGFVFLDRLGESPQLSNQALHLKHAGLDQRRSLVSGIADFTSSSRSTIRSSLRE